MKNLLQRVISPKNFKNYALLLSITLFLASLTEDCYRTELGECDSGFGLLLVGWAGIYIGGPMLTWLANPLLFIAWRTFKKPNYVSLIFSVLAAATAFSFLFFKSIFGIDEGMSAITHYMAGYWLWLASSLVMVMANAIILVKPQITSHAIAY